MHRPQNSSTEVNSRFNSPGRFSYVYIADSSKEYHPGIKNEPFDAAAFDSVFCTGGVNYSFDPLKRHQKNSWKKHRSTFLAPLFNTAQPRRLSDIIRSGFIPKATGFKGKGRVAMSFPSTQGAAARKGSQLASGQRSTATTPYQGFSYSNRISKKTSKLGCATAVLPRTPKAVKQPHADDWQCATPLSLGDIELPTPGTIEVGAWQNQDPAAAARTSYIQDEQKQLQQMKLQQHGRHLGLFAQHQKTPSHTEISNSNAVNLFSFSSQATVGKARQRHVPNSSSSCLGPNASVIRRDAKLPLNTAPHHTVPTCSQLSDSLESAKSQLSWEAPTMQINPSTGLLYSSPIRAALNYRMSSSIFNFQPAAPLPDSRLGRSTSVQLSSEGAGHAEHAAQKDASTLLQEQLFKPEYFDTFRQSGNPGSQPTCCSQVAAMLPPHPAAFGKGAASQQPHHASSIRGGNLNFNVPVPVEPRHSGTAEVPRSSSRDGRLTTSLMAEAALQSRAAGMKMRTTDCNDAKSYAREAAASELRSKSRGARMGASEQTPLLKSAGAILPAMCVTPRRSPAKIALQASASSEGMPLSSSHANLPLKLRSTLPPQPARRRRFSAATMSGEGIFAAAPSPAAVRPATYRVRPSVMILLSDEPKLPNERTPRATQAQDNLRPSSSCDTAQKPSGGLLKRYLSGCFAGDRESAGAAVEGAQVSAALGASSMQLQWRGKK